MMPFNTVKEFLALTGKDAPSEAERDLIAHCQAGTGLDLAKTAPTSATSANTIRASLLRLLITGATPACGLHARGVAVRGAWIEGDLDLDFCTARGQTVMDACHFTEQPRFASAKLTLLSLNGSHLPGLFAQGIETQGSVFLRNLTATATVAVNSAKIGGQLACDGATLNGAGGDALNAQSMKAEGGVFLDNLTANGTVNLAGAKIGGQLDCEKATLNGAGGDALNAQRMVVSSSFFFRDLAAVTGRIDLASAHVGDLADDAASWPKAPDDLILDGFTYDRLGNAPVTLAARRNWLAVGSSFEGDFFPHPYTQFARTLRAMGHPIEARRVMIEANVQRALRDRATLQAKRALQRQARRHSQNPTQDTYDALQACTAAIPSPARDWANTLATRFNNIHFLPSDLPKAPPPLPDMTRQLGLRGFQNDMATGAFWCQIKRLGNKLWNGFLHRTVGFGYAPHYSIGVLAGLILAAAVLAQTTWQTGSFAPNSAVILTSQDWQDISAKGCITAPIAGCLPNPADTWSAKNAKGMDWDSFSAIAYATDLVLPLVDLGQTSAWAPSKDRGVFGCALWWGRWVFILAGWIVASLGLAAVTGFVQKNAPE